MGENVYIWDLIDLDVTMSTSRGNKGKGLLDPNGGSGGKLEGGFEGNVGSCGGRGGSIVEGVELKANSEECLDYWVRAGGGEVKGGGVDFGVSGTLLGEIPGVIMRESGGEAFGVDGGAD
ncbi:hypothetical protein Tco_0887600 [Tanacetum coccineum]